MKKGNPNSLSIHTRGYIIGGISKCGPTQQYFVSFSIYTKPSRLGSSVYSKAWGRGLCHMMTCSNLLFSILFCVIPGEKNRKKMRGISKMECLLFWMLGSRHCVIWNALQTAQEKICWVRCPLITLKKWEQVFSFYR